MPQRPEQRPRLTLRTKFLAPVLASLALMLAAVLWIIERRITQAAEAEARATLAGAVPVLAKSLEVRAQNQLKLARLIVREPRFKAAALRTGARTFAEVQWDLLGEWGEPSALMVFAPADGGEPVLEQRRLDVPRPAALAALAPYLEAALRGEFTGGTTQLARGLFTVSAVPVTVGEDDAPVGALAIAVRPTPRELQDLAALTGTAVALLDPSGAWSEFSEAWPAAANRAAAAFPHDRVVPVEIDGTHYLALRTAVAAGPGARPLPAVLLASYEDRLREISAMRRTILGVGAAGLLATALAGWVIARRVTRPLEELRDFTEAIGRGDFTRRALPRANDETGDLARAFNRMAENLNTSRRELEDNRVALEQTVATLKATQAQLVQTEKLSAVGQFVAGVAHELNNPLTAVIGFAGLVQRANSGADEETRTNLDFIVNAADRCHRIVRSLLGFARQHVPERKLADANALLDEVIEIMIYDLRTSNVKVVKDYRSPLPPLWADGHQLQQVFINILANARQAITGFRKDGQVVLRTRATEAGRVAVELADNGPGIKPEHLAKIFDPFFTTKPVGKGTGLGMSLSYGIVQEHGGTIALRSEYGHGATFTIELPAAPADVVAQAPRDGGPCAVELPANLKVLVIDDELPILRLVRELLAAEGHRVETAESGERALGLLAQVRFDVLVCDWKMPGLSGVQLHDYLQTAEPALARRLVFMTGDIISDDFARHLENHARPCLKKPFTVEEFRAAVAQALRGA